MGYPEKLLSEDEEIVLETHPHWKVLVVPTLELLVVLAAAGFLLGYVDQDWARWATLGISAVLILALFVVPLLKWRTRLFVVTNKRVVMRSGILTRSGRDVPLLRINDVSYTETLLERLLRCGTLTVESAGERGQVVLSDIPRVAHVQRTIYEYAEKAERSRPTS